MTTVIEYKIYCVTEGQMVTGFNYAPISPVCPHNSSHQVIASSLQQIATISSSTVTINQSPPGIPGNFQVKGFELDVNADDGSTGLDITFPVPVGIKSIGYIANDNLVGDVVDGYGIPNYTQNGLVGILAQPLGIGASVVFINPESIQYFSPLFYISVNGQSLGEILSVDKTNSNVTLMTPSTIAAPVGSPVQVLIYRIRNYPLTNQQVMPIGSDAMMSSLLPAGSAARIVYTNNNGKAKKFQFFAELGY